MKLINNHLVQKYWIERFLDRIWVASRGKKVTPSGVSAFAAAARFTFTRPFIFLGTFFLALMNNRSVRFLWLIHISTRVLYAGTLYTPSYSGTSLMKNANPLGPS